MRNLGLNQQITLDSIKIIDKQKRLPICRASLRATSHKLEWKEKEANHLLRQFASFNIKHYAYLSK